MRGAGAGNPPQPRLRCPRMRRWIASVVPGLAALALAGCGGSGSAAAPSPAIDALSYFPPSSPFVAKVDTSPRSASVRGAEAIERANPTYAAIATAVFGQLAQMGIDYNRDVRPLFGHPVAVGAVGTSASGAPSSFLAAWVTTSAAKLTALIHKIHTLKAAGSYDGAALYSGGSVSVAVSGATLLLARTTAALDAALDRHRRGQGVTASDYARDTVGVAQNGIIEMFGDLRAVLANSRAANARRVPWVSAITGYAASLSGSANAVTLGFHVATNGRPLTAAQLPIASGATAPSAAGDLPLQIAVRDPSQIIDFIEAAEQATSPAAYARLQHQEATLRRQAGVDVNALVSMLTGDLNIESDGHTTLARAQVSRPAAVASMLRRLAAAHRTGVLGGRLTSLGKDLYAVTTPRQKLTLGLVGNELVVGRATASQLRAFAAAPSVTTSTASGSITFRIALGQLIALTLKHAPSATAQQLLGMLGDLTGSAGATTSGLTGTATLSIR